MKKVGRWWFPDNEVLMIPEIERNGSWQPHRLKAALKVIHLAGKNPEKLRTVADVGAHVGTWTAEFARRAKQVHAFEPVQETFDCLVANTVDLGNVHCYRVAMADRPRMVLPINDDRYVGNSGGTWMQDISAMETLPTEAVRANCLDSYDMPDLDLIKIDVEGMEPFVLNGAKRHLRKQHPVVIFENKPLFGKRYGWDEEHGPQKLLLKLGATCLLPAKGKDEVWGWL